MWPAAIEFARLFRGGEITARPVAGYPGWTRFAWAAGGAPVWIDLYTGV